LLHTYAYGAAPPVAVASTEPLACEHLAETGERESVDAGTFVTAAAMLAVQPLAPVTVTLYEPAANIDI